MLAAGPEADGALTPASGPVTGHPRGGPGPSSRGELRSGPAKRPQRPAADGLAPARRTAEARRPRRVLPTRGRCSLRAANSAAARKVRPAPRGQGLRSLRLQRAEAALGQEWGCRLGAPLCSPTPSASATSRQCRVAVQLCSERPPLLPPLGRLRGQRSAAGVRESV